MSSSYLKAQARCPIQQNFLPRDSSKENLDRFIPNRAAMDFDYAHFALTEGRNETTKLSSSPSKVAYRKQLAEALNLNRTRILAFKNKPQAPVRRCYDSDSDSRLLHQQAKPRRYIPQTRERELDLPDIVDDFSLNLLDWSSSNILAIALNRTVHLWNASNDSTAELVTVDEETGPITSLNWAKDGCYLAVGLNNSQVQLWDCAANREVTRLKRRRHEGRVGSLAWNNHMLTTGGMDGKIINYDLRIRSHVVNTYRGHSSEVCGLKWSESGYYLASGGTDNVAHIWDGRSSTPRLHRLQGHTSAVKGLAWCPFQSSLLATGGDETIKFWNIHTGACLNSVDAGSQVCSLLWSKKESELLSSHGSTTNQLTLWKYPSMVRMAKLTGHTSPVLYMAQSPDGCTVASASGDETLKTWNVFGDPEIAKKAAPRSVSQPFSHASLIR